MIAPSGTDRPVGGRGKLLSRRYRQNCGWKWSLGKKFWAATPPNPILSRSTAAV